jgi:hypothetical protein
MDCSACHDLQRQLSDFQKNTLDSTIAQVFDPLARPDGTSVSSEWTPAEYEPTLAIQNYTHGIVIIPW